MERINNGWGIYYEDKGHKFTDAMRTMQLSLQVLSSFMGEESGWIGFIFEDYELWGEFCYKLIKDIHGNFHKDVIVPMTLLRQNSYRIIENLRKDGINTHLVVLEADHQTVHDRILDRGEKEGCWCMENIDFSREGTASLAGLHVTTDDKTVAELYDWRSTQLALE